MSGMALLCLGAVLYVFLTLGCPFVGISGIMFTLAIINQFVLFYFNKRYLTYHTEFNTDTAKIKKIGRILKTLDITRFVFLAIGIVSLLK